MTEGQGKSDVAPTFSKRGYNKVKTLYKQHMRICDKVSVVKCTPTNLKGEAIGSFM